MKGSYEESFKSKVAISPTGCWIWMASLRPTGYGQFRYKGTTELAHRVAWLLFKGEIPKNRTAYKTMNVLHRCDTPRCVNPDHLFLGDQGDNISDAVSKGRWGKRGCQGESHGRARLTEEIVREILKSQDSAPILAARYRTSKGTIQHIRKRRTWRHLENI
jgi:HNH endonuclease